MIRKCFRLNASEFLVFFFIHSLGCSRVRNSNDWSDNCCGISLMKIKPFIYKKQLTISRINNGPPRDVFSVFISSLSRVLWLYSALTMLFTWLTKINSRFYLVSSSSWRHNQVHAMAKFIMQSHFFLLHLATSCILEWRCIL